MNNFIEEIDELTELLRNETSYVNVREMLKHKGFDNKEVILVSLLESEECNEYGVFISKEKKVYQWIANTNNSKYDLLSFEEKTEDERFHNDCPQIKAGLKYY